MLTCRRLVPVLLLLCAAAAQAQPAVPAVAPLPRAAPAPAAKTAPAASPAAADADAPPTSDPTPGTASAAAPARPAPAADAPPTSDAPGAVTGATALTPTAPAPAAASPDAPPTSSGGAVASAAPSGPLPTPNVAPDATASAEPAIPPTVTKNYPLTAEGNVRFLSDYAARPDVKKLENGVLYRVLHAADPKSNGPIDRGDTVTVSYRGWLIDGKVFDETKPATPVAFVLNGVVPGWRTALMKMKVGDMWEVAIPADQAYGAEGRPGRIPPDQTLIFVISLAKVEYAG
jgi:FKBP-type peptidyl-prolyl cis-trans isomerase